MKLTNINIDNITDEIIEKVLFSTPNYEYTYADCIIIFGCHLKPLLDERVLRLLEILKAKTINKILITGGVGAQGDFNEALYIKEKLLENGISVNKIIIEDKSTTTEENIINSIKILKEINLLEDKKIVLISSQAHLRRIVMEFKKQLIGLKYELFCEYPSSSMISFDNIINNIELREIAVKEIKKIIDFINKKIIDDEDI